MFGPVPRGYAHKLPKKVRGAALKSALSQSLADSNLKVVDDLQVEGYKTKAVVGILGALGLEGTTLIVIDDANPTVEASARNLPGVTVVRAEGLNVYDVLRHKNLLITQAAVAKVEARLAGGKA